MMFQNYKTFGMNKCTKMKDNDQSFSSNEQCQLLTVPTDDSSEEYQNLTMPPSDSEQNQHLNMPTDGTTKQGYSCFHLLSILPVLFLYMSTFTSVMLLNQQFIYQSVSNKHELAHLPENGLQCNMSKSDNDSQIIIQDIKQTTTKWVYLIIAAGILPSCLITSLLSTHSDKRGRKLVLILPMMGVVINSFITLMSVSYKLETWMIFYGSIIDGFTGSICTEMMVCFAYMADVTSHQKRGLGMILLELAIGFGVFLPTAGFGYLIDYMGSIYPHLVIIIINLISSLYVLINVKETVKTSCKADFKISQLKCLSKAIKKFMPSNAKSSFKFSLILSLIVMILVSFLDFGNFNISSVYMINIPPCFTFIDTNYFNIMKFVMSMAGLFIGMILLNRFFGDEGTLLLGSLSFTMCSFLIFEESSTTSLFIAVVSGIASQLILPMTRSIASKAVSPCEQGRLFAVVASLQVLTSFFGSAILTTIFQGTQVETIQKRAYLITSCFGLISAVISMWLIIYKRHGIKSSRGPEVQPLLTPENPEGSTTSSRHNMMFLMYNIAPMNWYID